MPTYNPNIPQGSDKLTKSQVDLLGNFGAADTSFGIDHVTFSDTTADNGKHQQCTFTSLAAKPTVVSPEVAVYNKSGVLYFEDQNANELVMLKDIVFTGAQTGQCPLFGGLGMKWGLKVVGGSSTTAVTYAGSGLTAFTTATYAVLFTYNDATVGTPLNPLQNGGYTASGFNIINSNTSQATVQWMTIGK